MLYHGNRKTNKHNTGSNKMNRYDTPLWKELETIQNQMTHIDIMTITGFMDDEQLQAHVERYRKVIADKQN